MLAGIALIASCSKEPEKKTAKKGGKAPASAKAPAKASAKAPAKAGASLPVGKSSLSAFRSGQYVTLGWQSDLAGAAIKKIVVSRNATGKPKPRIAVATLKPDAIDYKDFLPDDSAYWYWVKLVTEDGKFQEIGPARVENDKAGTASYIKPEDKYKVSIVRTDNFATLKWDFPEDEYTGIKIIRASRPVTGPFAKLTTVGKTEKGKKGVKGRVTSVMTSLERKSQYADALANPNSEYWYWFRITLKSGAIVDRGPIKAEYSGNK